MSDTIVVMNNGEIQQIGTPKQVYDEPVNAFVADFIGESNIMSGVMLEDYKVAIGGSIFKCLDKGYDKSEPVDLVIRPEDIELVAPNSADANLTGTVIQSVFKGDYYEMQVLANQYEFSVQVINGKPEGEEVGLRVEPNAIHIMKKQRIINEVKTECASEDAVVIEGGEFLHECKGFVKGDRVKAQFAFNSVEITDYTEDGAISGKVISSLYKGTYYQLIVRTSNEYDIFIDTKYEYSTDDEVGLNIAPGAIKLVAMTDQEVEEYEND